MATDLETIQERAEGMDATLAALPTLAFWIGEAVRNHTKARWGDMYHTAMAAWALHHQVLASRESAGSTGVAGPVQSRRTSDVSVTYLATSVATPAYWDGDMHLTTWGRLYQSIRGTRAAGKAGLV